MIKDVRCDALGDMQRRFQDVALRRIDQPHREVIFGDLLGHGFCRDDKHLFGDPGGFSGEYRHAHGGEDVDVVALARHEPSAADLDRRKRAAARENRPAAGPAIRLLGGAFRARGRVRVGKDDRPLVDLRHRLDHLAREQFRHGADADDAGGPDRPDRFHESCDRRPILGERLLKIRQIGPRRDQQAIDVEQGGALPRLRDIHAFHCHGLADQLGDAGPRRTAAEKQEPLIGEFLFGDAQCGEDARERDPGGALDVVVVGADLAAIAG
ncbi:MAG TPA: hypothetical protein VNF04_05060, partial [Stellaceae bacterium]|nr:hypothetical protein [Stellaceae bacterium]